MHKKQNDFITEILYDLGKLMFSLFVVDNLFISKKGYSLESIFGFSACWFLLVIAYFLKQE